MNCMANIVKFILWAFNIVFLLCGIFLITVGGIMSANNEFASFEDTFSAGTIAVLIIILGCIVFLISFMGCCGAMKENVCLMTSYAVCMFILFVLQLSLTIWIFVKRQDFLDSMSDVARKVWEQNDSNHGYPMDAMQISFNCCGLTGYENYGVNQVPVSCCGTLDKNSVCNIDTYKNKLGCQAKFVDFWSTNTDVFRWAGICIALLEFIVFTFACCLVSNMKKSRR